MTITQARATFGLNCRAIPTLPGASGSVQIGASNTVMDFPDADSAYSLRAIFAGAGDILNLTVATGDTTGSTAWVAGAQQTETNTVIAAAGITTSGNATVTVTATGMDNSPKAISVALTTAAHTTATLIAAAIAAGLNADTDYAALFTASSSGAAVISKRKATYTYTVPGGTVNIWPADIADHNIALANGTCAGITTAGSSTNTVAGVATDGVLRYDADGKDFEGVALGTMAAVNGVLLEVAAQGARINITGSTNDVFSIVGGNRLLWGGGLIYNEAAYDFTAEGTSALTVTIIGQVV